jgi:hypothetical protein
LTTFQFFSKSKLLPGLLKSFAKKQLKLNKNVPYKNEGVRNAKAFINSRTNILHNILRKEKKINIDFFSTFYGKVVFGAFNTESERAIMQSNDKFAKTIKSFNKTKYIKEIARSNVYSQLTEYTHRFIADKFRYQNIKKILGND